VEKVDICGEEVSAILLLWRQSLRMAEHTIVGEDIRELMVFEARLFLFDVVWSTVPIDFGDAALKVRLARPMSSLSIIGPRTRCGHSKCLHGSPSRG
jgi:hypothetical protein